MLRRALAACAAVLLLSAGLSASAQAPARGATPGAVSAYVRIGQLNTVIWRPAAPGPHAGVVLVGMHDEGNNMDHISGPNLAMRGYTIINANTRTAPDAEDRDTDWDKVLADVGAVVKYARAMPGVTKVLVLGHSSGGPLMAAYQNIAENGLKACNGPEKIFKCPASLAGLPKADGVILLDPIFGVGANVLASVDPAIMNEQAPRLRNPALDSFNPKNGFDVKGAKYSPAFKRAFFAAQAARNNRLIAAAQARWRLIESGQGRFKDDEPFVAAGATRRPRLWPPALDLLSHTKDAWPLIHADGKVTTEVVRSVRPPMGTVLNSDRLDGALDTSVMRFLNTFSTRALPGYAVGEDSITGVDWASSYTNTPNNVEGITVPFLVMGMGGHYWLVSTEMAYQHARSADKSVAFVEGATHGIAPCRNCGGDYGDTVGHTFDYIAKWMDARF
ncbi:MAG TPA: hypothetical protein VL460_06230 [Caulobacteraceae bacterium]|jgi:hypothetical protein|nr:hypothetical protein [Caulobacteraceae bacterium]